MNRILLVSLLLVAGCPKDSYAGNCSHFFYKQHHAVVQQVVVPYAYYAAGADIQADALAEKVSAKVLKLVQAQTAQQQKSAPVTVSPNVFSKCASCHSGANAAGGVVLDGQSPIECSTYLRWGEIAGLGENIPPKMQGVMSSLSDQEKGAINSAMIRLSRKVAKPSGDLE